MRNLITSVLTIVGLSLFSGNAKANECELTIEANDMMQFSTKTLSAPKSCEEVTVTLKHTGKLAATTMGHNWVLTKSEDVKAVATNGMSAGAQNSYVKPNDNRVIAFSEVIGGGEQTSVTFSTKGMSDAQSYRFFCSFPGHFAIMQGTFSLK